MTLDATPKLLRYAGIVTAAELHAEGKSGQQIKTLARRGALVPLGRGVYAQAGPARKVKSRAGGDHLLTVAAALAGTGPGAVVSHQSAARLHGIDLLGTPPPVVTLSAPPQRGWRGRTGIRLHAVDVPADQVGTRLGAPVTTAARTVVDLARSLEFRAGVVAADSALHRKLTTRASLRDVIATQGRWPGITKAAQVVDFADERAESPLESIARVLFRDLGLPAPDLQVWLGGREEPVGRVDFYWPDCRTVVEVDGTGKYQHPDRARSQLRRDDLLRADRFQVVHLSWHDVTQRPDLVARLIKEAFRRGRS
jgi:Transcriptional regulator, AbiEi antitoxin/Protein of unknown function (DUF559)